MMYSKSFIAAFTLVSALVSSADHARADEVDDYILSEMEARQIPGLALAVVKNGEIIRAKGYGVAVVEHDVPVTTETVFELASLTKQFTAVAILLLVEERKIGLDEEISTYLKNTPPTWEAITVRHLLSHTAGLPSLQEGFKRLREERGWLANYKTADMFEAATKDELAFQAGDKFQYSDVGYFLLGMIIEAVSGQRYREFIAERIFKPLDMSATTVINQWRIVEHRARGYTLWKGDLYNIRRDSQVELPSHFGILSTVMDLVKWDRALNGEKLLKPGSLVQAWTRVKLNDGNTYPYGFGWFVYASRGHRVLTHTGITGTEIYRLPDDGITVIVLNNLGSRSGNTEVNAWGLAGHVAEMYVPRLALATLKDLSLSVHKRSRYLGTYSYTDDGTRRRVYQEDERLFLETAHGPRLLLYQGSDAFEAANEDIRVVFTTDKSTVTGFTLTWDGNTDHTYYAIRQKDACKD